MRSESGPSIRAAGERDSQRRARLAGDCHAVLDLEGRFVFVSDDLAAWLDADSQILVGMDLEAFVHAETPRTVLQDLWRTLAAGGVWSFALQLHSGSGDDRWMTLTMAPDIHRGHMSRYLAHFRPAFRGEIAAAQASFDRLAGGAVFERGRCIDSGPAAWLRSGLHGGGGNRLAALGVSALGLALLLSYALVVWPELGGWMLRPLILGASVIAGLAGIAAVMLDGRRRRREYRAAGDLVERIARGEMDVAQAVSSLAQRSRLRDALCGLQLRLSIATAGFGTGSSGGRLVEEDLGLSFAYSERLRRVERQCSELVALVRRASDVSCGTAVACSSPGQGFTALLVRIEALSSIGQTLERTSRQSRVLSLNLALLESRRDVRGLDRVVAAARTISRETEETVLQMREELDRLKRAVQTMLDVPTQESQTLPHVLANLREGMAMLLEELRSLQPLGGAGGLGLRDQDDATAARHEIPPARVSPESQTLAGRSGKKVTRLKAVGSVPVPRVGRGSGGGPLEDDWRA